MASCASGFVMPSSSNITRPGLITQTQPSGAPLPLPIRVSAGFFVYGLSGKMRIHILPPRLIERVIATRAASIWRLVTHAGSSAISPHSPNATEEPRYALPFMRPRICFRYLTRFGISIVRLLPRARGRRSGLRLVEHLAVEHPHLDAAGAVRRERGRPREVDVGAERVQRHAPLAIGLEARHLGAAEAAGGGDADALGAGAHRRGDRLLHGAAERHALLELLGDVLGHQLGVEVGALDLLDVELHHLLGERLHLLGELVHLLALAPDDQPGPRGADADRDLVALALDGDARDACLIQALLEVALDQQVFLQELGVVALGEPLRVPALDDPEPEADRMCLLSHELLPRRHGQRDVAHALEQRSGAALGARQPALERRPRPHHRFLHVEVLDAHLALVGRVRHRGLEHLLNDAGAELGRELERGLRLLDGLPANERQHLIALARRDAHVALDRGRLHDEAPAPAGAPGLPGTVVFSATCWPWPRNTRVGTNSPSLWPTMFSVM